MAHKKIVKKDKSKKDALDPTKDEFVTRSMSVLDWVVERRRVVGTVLGLILVGWIGALVVNNRQQAKAEAASAKLGEALELQFAEVVDTTLGEDVPPRSKDEQVFDSVAKRSEAVLKKLKGLENSPAVSLVEAQALLDEGKADKALAIFEKVASKEGPLAENGLMGLAAANEALGKVAEAKAAYARLAGVSSMRVSLWGRLGQARMLQRDETQRDKAIAAYKSILDDISKSGAPDRTDQVFVAARTNLLTLDPDAEVPDLPAAINPQVFQQLMQLQQQTGGATP